MKKKQVTGLKRIINKFQFKFKFNYLKRKSMFQLNKIKKLDLKQKHLKL